MKNKVKKKQQEKKKLKNQNNKTNNKKLRQVKVTNCRQPLKIILKEK